VKKAPCGQVNAATRIVNIKEESSHGKTLSDHQIAVMIEDTDTISQMYVLNNRW